MSEWKRGLSGTRHMIAQGGRSTACGLKSGRHWPTDEYANLKCPKCNAAQRQKTRARKRAGLVSE